MTVMNFPIDSTAVEEMSYDTGREELTIVYTGGGEYVYTDVPQNIAFAAADADSVGQFVNQYIKGTYESYQPGKLTEKEVCRDLYDAVNDFQMDLSDMTDGEPAKVMSSETLQAVVALEEALTAALNAFKVNAFEA